MSEGVQPGALDRLRAAGWPVTHEVGRGMEGVVAALEGDRVVKLWDRRPRAEVDRLRAFYDAVATGLREAGAPFGVPRISEVGEVDGLVVTVHPRLRGRALALDGAGPEPVVEVLEWLARVEPHPDMAALPVPDGEAAFDPAVPFGWSMADLVERRAPLLADALPAAVVERLAVALRALEPVPPRLVHGDLGPVHVLLEDGRPTGLLDFGYVSTLGDPAFDAAVAACLQDMFSPGAAAATAAFDELSVRRLGHDPAHLVLHRAAYGLVTASCLAGHPGRHLTWCLDLVAGWERR
ncbi:aminoglycoside phosphotransferase family protein [Nocardioides sp. J2M5]|uniref:phosphotransferase family protein n=1 Tax=Nocardioides palaemonis TaxID=2829810 RepID=UPI001BA9BCBB|nr:aminoglycoside phosphotransferase family protein [Nocardioides palaemonis]MBS2940033.1 aminoglycoside phosphotransferase family protein [Nocardioides palaemonis]